MNINPMTIINLILLFLMIRLVVKMVKNTFGKSPLEFVSELMKGKSLEDMQKESIGDGSLKIDNKKLFEKLLKITGKTPIELFKLARDEKSFGFTDSNVERHLNRWVQSQCSEEDLPTYLEMFLEDGKDYIINA